MTARRAADGTVWVRYLRRTNDPGVACRTEYRADLAAEERRNAIEVGREHDGWIVQAREHIEASVGHGLPIDTVAEAFKSRCEPRTCLVLAPGCRIDVDEFSREGDGGQRIHS